MKEKNRGLEAKKESQHSMLNKVIATLSDRTWKKSYDMLVTLKVKYVEYSYKMLTFVPKCPTRETCGSLSVCIRQLLEVNVPSG